MAERGKKGCIKTSKGPWIVRRITKDGVISQHYRFPSERERQNNKTREQKRRSIARRIFAGLKAHGNYILPKHADTNDLLKALCEEAGWIVEEDGTIYKKETNLGISNLLNKGVEHPIPIDLKDEEYRHCIRRMNCIDIKILIPKINLCAKKYDENVNLELTL